MQIFFIVKENVRFEVTKFLFLNIYNQCATIVYFKSLNVGICSTTGLDVLSVHPMIQMVHNEPSGTYSGN